MFYFKLSHEILLFNFGFDWHFLCYGGNFVKILIAAYEHYFDFYSSEFIYEEDNYNFLLLVGSEMFSCALGS